MKKASAISIALVLALFAHTQPLTINNVRTPAHQPMARIKLSIVLPAGFSLSPDGMGFFQTGTNPAEGGPQIRGLKYFVDFSSIRESITSQSDAGAVTDVRINNYEGIWIKQSETINDRQVTSLTLAFGNATYCYVLAGFLPSADATLEANISRSIQSAYVDTLGYSALQTAGPPSVRNRHVAAMRSFQTAFSKKFSVDLTNTGFKEAEMISDDHYIYSLDGAYQPVTMDKSFVQVKKVVATVSESSYQEYSERIIAAYIEFNTVTNIRSDNTSINGLKGIELSADARSASEGETVQVYQVTLFEADAIYIITGVSYKQDAFMMDKFKSIATSFTRIQ